MEGEDHQKDIPIWFNGTQRWMAGLTRRTTCDDVIYAILYSSGLHEAESTDNFAIFEKWREVERPLSSRAKILKVWTFWGEEQPNVSLTMRSLNDYFLPGESSLYMRSRRRHKRSSRQRSRHSTNCKCHDRASCSECSRLKSLEHLVKLVVTQERKLQDIADRILHTDRLIEKHEGLIHEHRVQQNGLDYVQDSYLNSHSSGSGSSSSLGSLDSACVSVATLDLNEAGRVFPEASLAELGEITRMCDQLAHVERGLAAEQAKADKLEPEVERLKQEMGRQDREEEQDAGLEEARVQLLRAVTTHVTQEYNERMVDRRMEACVADMQEKAAFLHALQAQLSEADSRLASVPGSEGNYSDNEKLASTPDSHHTASGSSTPGLQPAQTQRDTTRLHTPEVSSAESSAAQSSGGNQNFYRPFERGRREAPDDKTTGLPTNEDLKPGSGPVALTPGGKSMTGRGRFAKENVRGGVSPVIHAPQQLQSNERRQGNTTPSNMAASVTPDDGRGEGGSRSLPLTNGSRDFHNSSSSTSQHPAVSNKMISQSSASGGFVDTTNVYKAGAGSVANNSRQRFSPHDNPNSQIPQRSAVDSYNNNPPVFASPADKTLIFSEHFPKTNRAVQNSVVNSVGSCGDISRADSFSSRNDQFCRDGRARTGFRGGGRESGQITGSRRSKSADRDRSNAQAQRSRASAIGFRQSQEHYNRRDEKLDMVQPYDMKVVNSSGHSEGHKLFDDGQGKLIPGPTLDSVAATNSTSLRKPNLSTHSQNGYYHNSNRGRVRTTEGLFQDPASNQQHFHNNTQHLNERSYSPSPGQIPQANVSNNRQAFSNKTQDETTSGPQTAEHRESGIPANGNCREGENGRNIALNSLGLDVSNDHRVGMPGTSGIETRNNAPFTQGIGTNSQNTPSNSYLSANVRVHQPSRINSSQPLTSQVHMSNNFADFSENEPNPSSAPQVISPFNNTTSSSPSNSGQTSSSEVKGSGESNSSRGALYHILTQKRNASKGKTQPNPPPTSVSDKYHRDQVSQSYQDNNSRHFSPQEAESNSVNPSRPIANGNTTVTSSSYTPQPDSQGGRSFVLSTSTLPTRTLAPFSNGDISNVSLGADRTFQPGRQTPSPSSQTFPSPSPNSREAPRSTNNTHPANSENGHHHQQLHWQNSRGHQQNEQQQQQINNHHRHPHYRHQQLYQLSQSQQNRVDATTTSSQAVAHNAKITPDNARSRRGALNPHFYDGDSGSANVANKKPPGRPPSSQQTKKCIINGSAGLIDYQDDSIISNLKHSTAFHENQRNNHPSTFTSSAVTLNGSSRAPEAVVTSAITAAHDSGRSKSKMEDSNDSDTGLSSMHSDETTNMETLV